MRIDWFDEVERKGRSRDGVVAQLDSSPIGIATVWTESFLSNKEKFWSERNNKEKSTYIIENVIGSDRIFSF